MGPPWLPPDAGRFLSAAPARQDHPGGNADRRTDGLLRESFEPDPPALCPRLARSVDGLLRERRVADHERRGGPTPRTKGEKGRLLALPIVPRCSRSSRPLRAAGHEAGGSSSRRPPSPGGASHGTGQVLFTSGSSGPAVFTPPTGLTTSPYPSASASWAGATMRWARLRQCSASDTSPRSAKYALRSPRCAAGVCDCAQVDLRPP